MKIRTQTRKHKLIQKLAVIWLYFDLRGYAVSSCSALIAYLGDNLFKENRFNERYMVHEILPQEYKTTIGFIFSFCSLVYVYRISGLEQV